MKKLLLFLALLPSFAHSAFRTDWLQNTSSSVTLNGTTYYWQAGSGSSGQFLTTNGSNPPTLTWATGGGSASISKLTPGATNFIFNQESLQTGATFYVSSGTVEGTLQVNTNGVFQSGSGDVLTLRNTTAPGLNDVFIRFQNGVSTNRAALGYEGSVSASQERGIAIYDDVLGEIARFGVVSRKSLQMPNSHPVDFLDGSSTNFVGFKGPSSNLSTSNTYVVPTTSGTTGQAITTDGSNNLGFLSVVLSTNGLQPGTTFYTSSGTVSGKLTIIDQHTNDALVIQDTTTFSSFKVYISTPQSIFAPQTYIPSILITPSPAGTGVTTPFSMTVSTSSTGKSAALVMHTEDNVFGSPVDGYVAGTVNGIGAFVATTYYFLVQGNEMRIQEKVDTDYVALRSSNSLSGNLTFILPSVAGTAGQALVTDGSNNLSFATISGGGGGGSPLEVFSNFDGQRSSPTLSISIGDALKMSVSGSTAVINVDFSSVTSRNDAILNQNTLQSGATFYVSSGTIANLTASVTSLSGIGAPTQVIYVDANGRLAGNSGLLYFDSASTLYSLIQVALLEMAAGFGAKLSAYNSGNSARVSFSAPAVSVTNDYILPYSSGTASQALTTDGSNNLRFQTVIVSTNGLQSGTTFYTSSGTVGGNFYSSTHTIYNASLSFTNATTNTFSLKASTSMIISNSYTLPISSGTANQVLATDGANNLSFQDPRQLLKFNTFFNSEQAKLPTTNPCVISNAGDITIPLILCDASTDESVTWSTLLTAYTTTTIQADIYYTMASSTFGNVVHNISVMCASTTYTADLDTESFGAINVSTMAVPSVAGRLGIATMTLTNMDTGCVKGGLIIFKYNRDANSSQDTASGDIEIRKIWFREP